jgi:hypothetical protein
VAFTQNMLACFVWSKHIFVYFLAFFCPCFLLFLDV